MDSTSIRASRARSLGKDDEQSSAKSSTNGEPESAEPETSTEWKAFRSAIRCLPWRPILMPSSAS
jgi:hypothetical protein